MTRPAQLPVAQSALPPTSDELVYALSVLLRARPESRHHPELAEVLPTRPGVESHGMGAYGAPGDEGGVPLRTTAPRIVLTVAEAAERLGIGRTLMYSLVSSGAVESVTIGRLRRIPEAALQAYVEQLRAANGSGGVAA